MQLISREYAVAVAKRTDDDIRKLDFYRIRNGKSFWVADPFPVEIDGDLYIFAEIFEYFRNKGSIGYTKLDKGRFLPWKKIIEEDYHMSFPYIFEYGGVIYMCPETSVAQELRLYRCVDFPERWEKDRVLIKEGRYSDTVFYKKNDITYGFTCIWESVEESKFKVFRIRNNDCEFSEGKIQTLDPFLTRPAGKVYTEKGRNIMVSQICRPLYGSGIIFKEFEIDWPNYTEKELGRVYPADIKCDVKKNYVGMHTYNTTDNYVVIDLIWNRFSLYEKLYHIKNRTKLNR